MTTIISEFCKFSEEQFIKLGADYHRCHCFVIGHADKTTLPPEFKHLAQNQTPDAEFNVVAFSESLEGAFAAAYEDWWKASKKDWFYQASGEEEGSRLLDEGWWLTPYGLVDPRTWTIDEIQRDKYPHRVLNMVDKP